jgi:drug/metabolite transporter (DMT)-like permease
MIYQKETLNVSSNVKNSTLQQLLTSEKQQQTQSGANTNVAAVYYRKGRMYPLSIGSGEMDDVSICTTGPWGLPSKACKRQINSENYPEIPLKILWTSVQRAFANVKANWRVLAFGQILSFLSVATFAAQATLALDCSLAAPSFTIGIVYLILTSALLIVYHDAKTNVTVVYAAHLRQGLLEDLSGAKTTHDASSQRSGASHRSADSSVIGLSGGPQFLLFGLVPLHMHALAYFPIALFDVYANYFVALSLKYTTLTSVTLLEALAIPSSMIISGIFLKREYTTYHYMGVAMCLLGIVLNVVGDYTGTENNDGTVTTGAYYVDYPHKVQGDVLAILGGVLFGASEVIGEVAIRNYGGIYEYLGMVGFWAVPVCALQVYYLEQEQVAKFFAYGDLRFCSIAAAWVLLALYSIAASINYLGTARFLRISDAAFYNISLLTGGIWSCTFSVLFEGIVPQPIFYIAAAMIVAGVVLYEMASSPVGTFAQYYWFSIRND